MIKQTKEPQMNTDSAITALARSVMTGVARSGTVNTGSEMDTAVTVMREEIKALVIPSEDVHKNYEAARACAISGSMHSGYVVGLVIARCIERIKAEA